MRVKVLLVLIVMGLSASLSAQNWYSFGNEVSLSEGASGYYWSFLWPDTMVQVEYSNGMGRPWQHSIGQVLDPSSEVFDYSGEMESIQNSYVVDSIGFPMYYLRSQSGAADTLLIQFFTQDQLELMEQPWPDWNAAISRASLPYDYMTNRGVLPYLEIIELLDEADVTGSDNPGWFSYPLDVEMPAGGVVAATLTYIPGNAYALDDTLSLGTNATVVNQINQAVPLYYFDESLTQITGDFNHAFNATTDIRYNMSPNGWNGEYQTGNSYNLGVYHNDIQFYLTADVVEGIEEQVSKDWFELSPNPVNDQLTVDVTPLSNSVYNLMVVDGMGRKVLEVLEPVAGAKTIKINTASLSEGLYYVQMISENRKYSKRFVKIGK